MNATGGVSIGPAHPQFFAMSNHGSRFIAEDEKRTGCCNAELPRSSAVTREALGSRDTAFLLAQATGNDRGGVLRSSQSKALLLLSFSRAGTDLWCSQRQGHRLAPYFQST